MKITLGRSTIRTQLVVMFLVVTLPLFIASIILLVNMNSLVEETTLSSASSSANSLKMRISDIISSVEATGDALCSDKTISGLLTNEYETKEEYYQFYLYDTSAKNYISFCPQIKNAYIYTDRTDFVENYIYKRAVGTVAASDWYGTAKKNISTGKWWAITNENDGEVYLSYVKAITNSSGEVIGVCLLEVSNDWINTLMTDTNYNTIFAVQDGLVYYSSYSSILCGYFDFSTVFDIDVSTVVTNETIEGGFSKDSFTIINTFKNTSTSDNFQIFIILPKSIISQDTNKISVIYGVYCALLIIISLLMIILFTSVFSRRISKLSDTMHSVASGNFNVDYTTSGNDEISALFSDLHVMVDSMQSLMDEVYRAEIENESIKYNQMEAEFKALASQINPHFLYNTLETIRMKAYCNEDIETAALVKKLGKFMRRCLEFKDGEVTLRSELEFTRDYLELQTARFGDRVSYSMYSEVDKDYMILPLIIQPLVENAFVHGVESSKKTVKIEVRAYYADGYIYIDVCDNGAGIPDDRMKELLDKLKKNDTSSGKSIGLTNVNKRVMMYHGEEYHLTIKSVLGEGTTMSINLPCVTLGKSKPELLLEKNNRKPKK